MRNDKQSESHLTILSSVLRFPFSVFLLSGLLGWAGAQMNLPAPGQRPSDAEPGRTYLGSESCAVCHPYQSRTYHNSAMANALVQGAGSAILSSKPEWELDRGTFQYRIQQGSGEPVFEVSDGKEVIRQPILWAFGTGRVGQTYLIRHQGRYIESRVSYFSKITGLDLTIGAPREEPDTLEQALGRALSEQEARDCFGCHATAAVEGSTLQTEQMTAGITCEGCHGPGERHKARMDAGEAIASEVFALSDWISEEVFEFCGACHGTEQAVMQSGLEGKTASVRFQPYRLAKSRCNLLREPDNRALSCVTCHDPHKPLARDAAFYDSRCLACHEPGSNRSELMGAQEAFPLRPGCTVGSQECVLCHMPKTPLPGAHHDFTDHLIQIPKEQPQRH